MDNNQSQPNAKHSIAADQLHAQHVSFARQSPLGTIIAGETVAALLTAASVAPAIAIVDQSIFSSASGRESMMRCIVRETMRLVRSPVQMLRSPSVRWICAVYGTTYTVANVGESLYMRYFAHDDGHVSAKDETATVKFVLTSTANVTMSVAKDRAFAHMFGAVGHAVHAVPISAMSLFALRDCITVGASFTLVPTVTSWVQSQFNLSHKRADTVAQLVTPCAAQVSILSEPLGLVVIDRFVSSLSLFFIT